MRGRSGRGGDKRPHRPSAPPAATPEAGRSGGDARPPRELEPDPTQRREFDVGDEAWTAWVAGKGAWGSGARGLGMVVAVHFALASNPDRPVREALLPRGRFLALYDEELRALLEQATPIEHGPARSSKRRRERRSRDW